MLTGSEITAARAQAQTTMTATATVRRATAVSDGGGGQTITWNTIGTVPARVAPAGAGGEAIEGGQVSEEGGYRIAMPAGTDITERDRLVIDGATYEVHGVHTRTLELERVVDATRAVA